MKSVRNELDLRGLEEREEAAEAADEAYLNCPTCAGSGHIDDHLGWLARTGASPKRDLLLRWLRILRQGHRTTVAAEIDMLLGAVTPGEDKTC
jgi:hypothetical protein